jgi:hypothetical protein
MRLDRCLMTYPVVPGGAEIRLWRIVGGVVPDAPSALCADRLGHLPRLHCGAEHVSGKFDRLECTSGAPYP